MPAAEAAPQLTFTAGDEGPPQSVGATNLHFASGLSPADEYKGDPLNKGVRETAKGG
jgi:hypothetical protein